MMYSKAKKLALALSILSAVTAGGYVSARALDAAPSVAQREKSEKQKAFEDRLVQKNAEFERKFNEVKARNDEIRREFDSLPSPSESELRDALAQSLKKHEQE